MDFQRRTDPDEEPFVTWGLVAAEVGLGVVWFLLSAMWALAHAFGGRSDMWDLLAVVFPPVIVAVVLSGQRLRLDRRTLRRAIWASAISLTAVWLVAQLLAPNH